MTAVVVVSSVMLVSGVVMAVIRVERGPSMLDRAVALDVITSTLIFGAAVEGALTRRTETVPVLAALALVGFVASVAMARFVSVEPEEAGRIKTVEEIRAEEAALAAAEDEEARREAEAIARREEEL